MRGIEQRHVKACSGKRCDGSKGCAWRASVWDNRAGRRIRASFPTRAAAENWRMDARRGLRLGTLQAADSITLAEAGEAWLDGTRTGLVTRRNGTPYRPAAIRAYETALRRRLLPAFGPRKLSDIRRIDLQDFVDTLRASGLSPSAVRVTLQPLSSIYRREIARGRLAVNPATGLELPAVKGGRDRIADPEEASRLLEALAFGDRALWATAMYGGLRRGELMALRAEDVDLPAGVIDVHRGWDIQEGEIGTKAGNRRRVPIPRALRAPLSAHLLATGRRDADLVFGATASLPFRPDGVTARADRAWTAAGLDRITLHECRHTFASLMIAAGVNAKALSIYMGHSSITMTLDKYGHLVPGNEGEAAQLLDTYLEHAQGAGR